MLAEPGIARVFISHASADAPLVEELVELLEIIGIRHDQIFCSSFPGYGIDLGDNFLEALKAQLDVIYPGLGELVEDREPSIVVIEARGDVSQERNQTRVAAVAALEGSDSNGGLPHIKRWFDRAPWEGGLPGSHAARDEGTS